MTAQDYVVIITAAGSFVGILSAALIAVIKALKENTAVTRETTAAVQENTADRAVKAAVTDEKLSTIGSQVQDIHAGTTEKKG